MCNFTAQNFRDDIFFILFHIISALDIAIGASLRDFYTFLYVNGICDKV
jgi:hypothetical protein